MGVVAPTNRTAATSPRSGEASSFGRPMRDCSLDRGASVRESCRDVVETPAFGRDDGRSAISNERRRAVFGLARSRRPATVTGQSSGLSPSVSAVESPMSIGRRPLVEFRRHSCRRATLRAGTLGFAEAVRCWPAVRRRLGRCVGTPRMTGRCGRSWSARASQSRGDDHLVNQRRGIASAITWSPRSFGCKLSPTWHLEPPVLL